MKNSFSLEGKTILITGASSGIGRSTAIECSKMGAKVIITGRNEDRLNEALSQLHGDRHMSIVSDVRNDEDVKKISEEVPALDGICLAVGITKTIPIKFIKSTDIEEIFSTNLTSSIKLINFLTKKKKLNKNGSIVFISSISSSYADIGNSVYAATKGGIISFARVLALEFADKKIRVNCISPGFVEGTGMTQGLTRLTEEQINLERSKYPLGFGETSDIANGVVYLLSDASKWVTGITLTIDGGITLK